MDNEGAFSQCGTKEWQMNALTSMGTGINAKTVFCEGQTARTDGKPIKMYIWVDK